jgi:flavin-dependent dehydrogenase
VVFDIVINGAGVSGCALAIASARAGYSVLMLERALSPAGQPGESLPPEARVPLAALGVWEGFLADGHRPALGNRAVWGADVDRCKDFLFNPYGNGWHIDRYRFDVMLQRAAEAAGAVMHCGINRTETAREDFLWRVSWRDQTGAHTAMARFVADATGRARRLARRLGVVVRRYDRLIGWAGCMPVRGRADCTTLVEAVPHGWWYSVPLPSARHMVAFMSDPGVLPPKNFPPHISLRVGNGVWKPRAAAAGSSCLVETAGAGWVAVGDAAAAHDPLSAQGIMRALMSGLRAAEAVTSALAGRCQALERYAEMQRWAYEAYLIERRDYYRAEGRWPMHSFWSRRHCQAVPLSEGV